MFLMDIKLPEHSRSKTKKVTKANSTLISSEYQKILILEHIEHHNQCHYTDNLLKQVMTGQ